MDAQNNKKIRFESVEIDFHLDEVDTLISWLENLALAESKTIEQLQYIFCSDTYLHVLNKEYLDHDDYTDILTFPYSYEPIRSDLYISVDRIKDNALTYKSSFENELHRVMAHGLLHLCGYLDKDQVDQIVMRQKENYYLKLLDTINVST